MTVKLIFVARRRPELTEPGCPTNDQIIEVRE
jgi:hypothetical protein